MLCGRFAVAKGGFARRYFPQGGGWGGEWNLGIFSGISGELKTWVIRYFFAVYCMGLVILE